MRGFVDEFEAVMCDAGFAPGWEVTAGFLGFGAEYGIAAAYVGHYGMGSAGVVTEGDAVLFAGVATVFEAGSRG